MASGQRKLAGNAGFLREYLCVRCIKNLRQAKSTSSAAALRRSKSRGRSLPTAYCLLPTFLGLLPTLFLLAGCTPTVTSSGDAKTEHKPTVAYVTNGIAAFWVVAAKGAEAAARDANVELLIRMPPDGVGDQKAHGAGAADARGRRRGYQPDRSGQSGRLARRDCRGIRS